MKIAILTPTLWYSSGIDRAVEQQAKALTRRKQEVSIFVFDAQLKIPGLPIIVLGMPKSLFWQRIYRLFFFLDIPKIIFCLGKLKDFKMVYAHQYPMTVVAALARIFNQSKYVYYNYGIAPATLFPSVFEKMYIILFSFLTRLSIFNVQQVISISRYLAREFQIETGKKSLVKYLKIDGRFKLGMSGLSVRKRYRLKKSPVILYVGRISPHKGVHLLLEVFRVIKKDIPDARLLIVGQHTFGDYSQSLKEIAKTIGLITFCGEVVDEELPSFYAAADLYTTCTLWEGFDLPVVEAQTMGKPVVAFDIGPHREIANQKTILVPVGDKQRFAEACLKFLQK